MSQAQQEYDKFILVTKRILKEKLSTNPTTLEQYRWDVVTAYNVFVKFVVDNFYNVDKPGQTVLKEKTQAAREKLVACLNALGCLYELPKNIFEEIDVATIGNVAVPPGTSEEERQKQERERREEEERQKQEREKREEEEREKRERERREEEEERQRREREDQNAKMTDPLKAQKELLDIVNGQIRKPYDGNPMGLQTFITGVEIAKDFANTGDLKTKLVAYVKGRLEGRARELIPDGDITIEQLIEKLKQAIKPENSKIIEARIASLHYSYAKQEEFATKAEELTDALRRTLIIEGIAPTKANEMTIDRTIQLCSRSANSDVVKAILGASSFNTAKEVVAKLITSNDQCVKDRQVLRYQRDNGKNQFRGKNGRGRGYQNQRGNRGYFNGTSNWQQNKSNGGYRGKSNNRGRGNNNYGRGYYQNGYRNQSGSGGSNNGNWRLNQNVRLAQSGNVPAPQALMGVDQN